MAVGKASLQSLCYRATPGAAAANTLASPEKRLPEAHQRSDTTSLQCLVQFSAGLLAMPTAGTQQNRCRSVMLP